MALGAPGGTGRTDRHPAVAELVEDQRCATTRHQPLKERHAFSIPGSHLPFRLWFRLPFRLPSQKSAEPALVQVSLKGLNSSRAEIAIPNYFLMCMEML